MSVWGQEREFADQQSGRPTRHSFQCPQSVTELTRDYSSVNVGNGRIVLPGHLTGIQTEAAGRVVGLVRDRRGACGRPPIL